MMPAPSGGQASHASNGGMRPLRYRSSYTNQDGLDRAGEALESAAIGRYEWTFA